MFLYNLFVYSLQAGKSHIPDGSGSGSATVGQSEIFTLTHQPELWTIHLTK